MKGLRHIPYIHRTLDPSHKSPNAPVQKEQERVKFSVLQGLSSTTAPDPYVEPLSWLIANFHKGLQNPPEHN